MPIFFHFYYSYTYLLAIQKFGVCLSRKIISRRVKVYGIYFQDGTNLLALMSRSHPDTFGLFRVGDYFSKREWNFWMATVYFQDGTEECGVDVQEHLSQSVNLNKLSCFHTIVRVIMDGPSPRPSILVLQSMNSTNFRVLPRVLPRVVFFLCPTKICNPLHQWV